jgi:protein gp37
MGRGVVKWTGKVNLLDWRLKEVMRLKRPRVIAVNLMGDLFHPNVPDAFIERVFLMMTAAWWHKFMVLTKRPERAVDFFKAAKRIPLSNIWMGTTAGTQRSANERWGAMAWLEQAGWRTWVSSEPRLEAIDWHGWAFLRWMVTGGESGPYARPMSPAWARADRDWCQEHGVAFWFKQWGEWGSTPTLPPAPPHFGVHEMGRERRAKNEIDESEYPMTTMGREMVFRFGRKLAGRMLDGRTWEDTPLDFPFGGEEALR